MLLGMLCCLQDLDDETSQMKWSLWQQIVTLHWAMTDMIHRRNLGELLQLFNCYGKCHFHISISGHFISNLGRWLLSWQYFYHTIHYTYVHITFSLKWTPGGLEGHLTNKTWTLWGLLKIIWFLQTTEIWGTEKKHTYMPMFLASPWLKFSSGPTTLKLLNAFLFSSQNFWMCFSW